jgi:hypothetical protein
MIQNVKVGNNAVNSVGSVPTFGASVKRGSRFVTQVCGAGASLPISVPGDRFVLFSAPAPLSIRIDTGEFSTFYPGTGYRSESSLKSFSVLEVKNTTAADIPFTIWVGFDDLINNIVNAGVYASIVVNPIEGMLNGPLSLSVPTPLSQNNIYFTQGTFWGISTFTNTLPVNNLNNIYIGKSKLYTADIVQPGSWVTYQPNGGQFYNLANICACGSPGTDAVFYQLV